MESETIEAKVRETFNETKGLLSNLRTRKESDAVRLYLKWAANAGEKAAAAVDEKARKFYRAMESRWMDLAASTAVVERVDLFLHTRGFRLHPSDLCPHCHDRMLLVGMRVTEEADAHTF